jgi:hypothetical protein
MQKKLESQLTAAVANCLDLNRAYHWLNMMLLLLQQLSVICTPAQHDSITSGQAPPGFHAEQLPHLPQAPC